MRISRWALLALLAGASHATGVTPPAGNGDPQRFTVRVENVSTAMTLKLSNGETAPAPTAPALWLVHTSADPLFAKGRPDRGLGLERLAEDGSPSALASSLQGMVGVTGAGFVNTPMGAMAPGPILPGNRYEFEVTATAPGQRLTLAFMFGQSNDLFYAPAGDGIPLFDRDGKPVSGDVTSRFQLWDAGTEVNQEPGLGPDQAPRQKAENTGTAENGSVRLVRDAFTYPATRDVIRVTITPTSM
jgi:hypothetical protein